MRRAQPTTGLSVRVQRERQRRARKGSREMPNWNITSPDVFICHASTDKDEYARPLGSHLRALGITCWVDETEIEVGDTLTQTISDGLRSAKYVLALATPTLLIRPWPKKELEIALDRETQSGETVVIPVLATSRSAWVNAFPKMADRHCLAWSDGIEEVATAVAGRFGRLPATEWFHTHTQNYVGEIWTRCTAINPGHHKITIRWGRWMRKLSWTPTTRASLSLIHHKTNTGRTPLFVTVEPEAIITFGQGSPPDMPTDSVNIDHGWIRTKSVLQRFTRRQAICGGIQEPPAQP
ncbi:MAG: toll/interleukin-1 receptor domain-containing protein [Arachnia sp.]